MACNVFYITWEEKSIAALSEGLILRIMTKAGLFCIGLDTYWKQFEGLRERLSGYQQRVADRIGKAGVQVVDAGMVDTTDKARKAARLFKKEGVDIVFLYISTYALSQTVLPIALENPKTPLVILNLQPSAALDYESFNALGDREKMTGEWLANCQACSVPEIAGVFNNASINYDIVSGWLDDETSWKQIKEWLEAASIRKVIRDSNFGILGHYYEGMLDVYTDVTRLASVFGCQFTLLEMDYLKALRDSVSAQEVAVKISQFSNEFSVSPECELPELERAARTSCALDKMVEAKRLGGLAYYYEGVSGNDHENIITSIIPGNTLLTSHNIPVAGECEVKNLIAMKILDAAGYGGSFSEFYLSDFTDDVILLGHDGPAHASISDGKVRLVPLPVYHGKPGKGLSIQMSVRKGPVTLLSVVQGPGGSTKLLIAEADAVPGPILLIGNTNSRYRFPISARTFINNWSKAGPAHHCAIGTGHLAGILKKLAALLGIESIVICESGETSNG